MNENRKALLVVSFGTSYDKAREKAIYRVEQDLSKSFPEYDLYTAMSSLILLKKLKSEGIRVYSIAEALENLVQAGYQEVLIQSLQIIKGHEYEKISKQVELYQDKFLRIKVGQPLLSSQADSVWVVDALLPIVEKLRTDEGLILMGHGSTHQANDAYNDILAVFRKKGVDRVWMATVEGAPTLKDILPELKQKALRKFVLMPFMLVAGEHAHQDMAGEGNDSWQSVLLLEGYEVQSHLTGLGEIDAIRRIFIAHAKQALEQD